MKINFVLILIVLSVQLKSQTVDEILDKYYSSMGGKEKWSQINSRIDKIETVRVADMLNHHKPLQPYKTHITYKIAKRKDSIVWDRFSSVDSPGDTATSCFNGTNYWMQKNREDIVDFDYYVSRYARFANLGDPDLLLRADKYSFIGNKKVDGITCNVIRVTIDSMEIDHYFDTETSHLVMYHQNGKDLQTKLSDYRNVDGLVIPFKLETINKYGFVSSSLTTEVIINPFIDNNYFSKETGPGLLVK